MRSPKTSRKNWELNKIKSIRKRSFEAMQSSGLLRMYPTLLISDIMKHHFIKRASIWTSTSILVLFTACVNQIESETDIKEGNIPINFSIKIKETATKVSENAFEAGDEVGVYGILTGNQINDERYIDNLLLKYTTGNNLIPEKPVFYPEGDATLDFIAYHPYQPNAISPNSSTIPISIHSDQSNSSNRSSSDFMTAVTEKVSNSNSSVSLEFHHRLTKLKISLLPGENEDIDEMLAANPRIIASNFYTQANYDFTTEEFSQFDHIADIISAGEWKKTEGKLSGKEFIFIPQDIDNTQSFQMEWNGRIYTCPMPPIDRLESNKQYELEINAEETESLELEGVVATIKDWEDGIPLENVEFTLYNINDQELLKSKSDQQGKIIIHQYLKPGTYYLKETTTGVGYLPNNETYKIEFTPNNTKINLVIENEVLKKEVTIKKYFGDGKLMESESNISFEIYDINNNLVDTITTDVNGTAKITLPYGHYKIVQVNTTEGYTKIEPFEIFINDINKEYTYTINDYKKKEEKPKETISIVVPNTSTEKNSYPLISITLLPAYFLAKKKFS